jgi:glycosyltransferase involved in cell wall biosynthesis
LPLAATVRTELVRAVNIPQLRISFSPGLKARLAALGANADLIHDHGLWLPFNNAVSRIAHRENRLLVVSPRGMLDDWALKYRGWKKRLAWTTYQGLNLQRARAFSVTSNREAEAIRRLGLKQPVGVIPNGIALPANVIRSTRSNTTRRVVFMSRLHPKKGLLDLVHAWKAAALPNWELVIAGPDEGGYQRQIEVAIASTGLAASVHLLGPVEGAEKESLLSGADLFVLPSYSENFGIVIGEALSYGVPVIATDVTPWKALREDRCGWWIATGVPPLADALTAAMAMSDEQRVEMGKRGRELIERRFSWSVMGQQHLAFYDWLLHRADRPGFVIQ